MISTLIDTIEKCTFADRAKKILKMELDLIKEVDAFMKFNDAETKFNKLEEFRCANHAELPNVQIFTEKERYDGKDGTVKYGKHEEYAGLAYTFINTEMELSTLAAKIEQVRSKIRDFDLPPQQDIRSATAIFEDILYGKQHLDRYTTVIVNEEHALIRKFKASLRDYYIAEYIVCKALEMGFTQCLDPHLAKRAESVGEVKIVVEHVREELVGIKLTRQMLITHFEQEAAKQAPPKATPTSAAPVAFFKPQSAKATPNAPTTVAKPALVAKPKAVTQTYIPVPAPPKPVTQTYISVPVKQPVKQTYISVPVKPIAAPQAAATPPVQTSALVASFYAKKATKEAAKQPVPAPRPPVKMTGFTK